MLYAVTVITHLEDVDGWLVDRARDSAACVDNVADHAHDDGRRPGIQTCSEQHRSATAKQLTAASAAVEAKSSKCSFSQGSTACTSRTAFSSA